VNELSFLQDMTVLI